MTPSGRWLPIVSAWLVFASASRGRSGSIPGRSTVADGRSLERVTMSTKTGPNGFWCRNCGKYLSCRNRADTAAAKAHQCGAIHYPGTTARLARIEASVKANRLAS